MTKECASSSGFMKVSWSVSPSATRIFRIVPCIGATTAPESEPGTAALRMERAMAGFQSRAGEPATVTTAPAAVSVAADTVSAVSEPRVLPYHAGTPHSCRWR